MHNSFPPLVFILMYSAVPIKSRGGLYLEGGLIESSWHLRGGSYKQGVHFFSDSSAFFVSNLEFNGVSTNTCIEVGRT